MSTLLFERPVWFVTNPLFIEEEAHEMEDFIYHRPVLESEVVKLLAPRPGSLVVDGTCGGGGHTEALLRAGADVLALDQDPDAVQHVSEQLGRFGRRVAVLQANFRHANKVLGELGIKFSVNWEFTASVARFSILVSPRGNSKMRSAVLVSCATVRLTCAWTHETG